MVNKGDEMKHYVNMIINFSILGLLIWIAIMIKDIHEEVVNDCPTCMIPLSQPATDKKEFNEELDTTIRDMLVLALNQAKEELNDR
jgi:hypothetical protein